MARGDPGCQERPALNTVKRLQEEAATAYIDDHSSVFNQDVLGAIELGFMLDCAVAVAHSALAREESRGAHARRDFPERNDEKYLKHTIAHHTEAGPRLEYRDVTLGKFEPKARAY